MEQIKMNDLLMKHRAYRMSIKMKQKFWVHLSVKAVLHDSHFYVSNKDE